MIVNTRPRSLKARTTEDAPQHLGRISHISISIELRQIFVELLVHFHGPVTAFLVDDRRREKTFGQLVVMRVLVQQRGAERFHTIADVPLTFGDHVIAG